MTSDTALLLVSRMLLVGILIASPLLLAAMIVGVVISIFQVVTQIQEVSLSFIPKILTVILVLVAFGPWMLKKLVNYSASMIAGIPGYL